MRPEVQLIIFGATSSASTDTSPPAAPTLTLISGVTDSTPDFALTGALLIDDVMRFQYSTDSGFAGASEITAIVTFGGEIDFSTGALADNTWYFRARIERPGHTVSNWSNTVSETIDTTAPTLSLPLGTKTGITTASLGVTTNEAGTGYVVVVLASDSAPSATQITQGKNVAGTAAKFATNQAFTTGAQTISGGATGLDAATSYKAHYAQKDAALNLSAVSSSASFTTDAASSTVTVDQLASANALSASGTSMSFNNQTVKASPVNGALVATVIQTTATNLTGMTLTWDSGGSNQAMTLVSTKAIGGTGQVWVFALRNPTSGNKTLALSWTGTGQVFVDSISLEGVLQTNDAAAFANAASANGGATPSVTVASQANDMVITAFASLQNFTGSYSGTEIFHNNGTPATWTSAASRDAGGASVTATAALASANTWLAASIDVVHA